MSRKIQPDAMFKVFIETFADAFGIQFPEEMQTQVREIMPEFVQMDTVVVFPDGFDFSTLSNKILPFLGKYVVIEYKGENDALTVMRFYQYTFTELGIIATYLLSKQRKDRKEREALSQRAVTQQWQQLNDQNATHSCAIVILSTTDPTQLRKKIGFEPVNDYPHLKGALHRLVISSNEFVGSMATYLVVLNHLPVVPKNAPLLLLAKGRKQDEFCRWLVEEDIGITWQQRQLLLYYIFKYSLIQNPEVQQEMTQKLAFDPEDYGWFLTAYEHSLRKNRAIFLKEIQKKLFDGDNPEEAAQLLMDVDSPIEMALKTIKNDEQRRELIERLQQTSY